MGDQKQRDKRYDPLKHLFAGGVAGAVSRTVTSPLERVKILFQLQRTAAESQYLTVSGSLKEIWKEEGFKGFMRGNGTNVIRIVPYSAIQFASYEQFKKHIFQTPNLNPLERFICGALAGIVSVVGTYPLDLVRTRLSACQKKSVSGPGIVSTFKLVVQNEGFRGLYKGIVPTIVGIAPYVGLNFMCYETLKNFGVYMGYSDKGELPVYARLICGGTAGAIAQTFTYPLDVLRRRMQMQGASPLYPVYGTTWNCIKETLKLEGARGFYKGLFPNLLKVVPSVATTFVTYELVKKLLNG